jgi:hypothetical protein
MHLPFPEFRLGKVFLNAATLSNITLFLHAAFTTTAMRRGSASNIGFHD